MKHDGDFDGDLRTTEFRVIELSRRVDIDAGEKSRLRSDLLRRHRELATGRRRRADRSLWLRAARFKRVTFAAPAALAVTLAVSLTLFALQISGHQRTQTADAAHISQAFAHTVPSISGWRWTLHEQRGSAADAVQFRAVLNQWQALRIYYGHPYLYDRGHWTSIAWDMDRMANGIARPTDWEWAFAILPSLLGDRVTSLPGATLDGRPVVRFADVSRARGGQKVVVTAWVDAESGLVLRLDRTVRGGQRVLEHDVVDYRYRARTA
jgi:hypothetical protein